MIQIFRRIRHGLISEGHLSKYLAYAVGEILLVVIGILIALQINDANEQRLERKKELQYLESLKTDLGVNVTELEKFIADRQSRLDSAHVIMGHFEGKPVSSLEDFAYNNIHVMAWTKFYQNNNTFQELVNSGSLSILSNQEIKSRLMDLELLYKKMKSDEDHMRFDFEGYMYDPLFVNVDVDPMQRNYVYRLTSGALGDQPALSRGDVDKILASIKMKNGFAMAILMLGTTNDELKEIQVKTRELIELIDEEMSL
jgi:hypothetical protein